MSIQSLLFTHPLCPCFTYRAEEANPVWVRREKGREGREGGWEGGGREEGREGGRKGGREGGREEGREGRGGYQVYK
jgi:hypothetical protein